MHVLHVCLKLLQVMRGEKKRQGNYGRQKFVVRLITILVLISKFVIELVQFRKKIRLTFHYIWIFG